MKVLALLLAFVGTVLAESLVKTCDEDPDPGMCLAYMPMYYYDKESGTCKKFIYGGCQGNGNRYKSEEECLKHCASRSDSKDPCALAPEAGVCDAYIPSYYYDNSLGKCVRFVYGGCGGNANRYRTETECYKACPRRDRDEGNLCELEATPGLCKAYIPRYFYNSKTGQCEEFIYGGCGGNGNNFRTKEACENRCGQRTDVSVCALEAETGPCRAYIPSYYYNSKTGKCEKFIYGGCRGNGNRFKTEEECHGTCGQIQRADDYCNLKPETGVCRGYFPRYFFNKDTGICEEFVYGGCGGNKNNFYTFEDCTAACGSV